MERRLNRRIIGREMLLALLVLALAFLNFGHVSMSSGGEYYRLAPDGWCGGPVLPHAPDHPPCHACRIGSGADLPPAPARLEPVRFVAFVIDYPALAERSVDVPTLDAPSARGPPAPV